MYSSRTDRMGPFSCLRTFIHKARLNSAPPSTPQLFGLPSQSLTRSFGTQRLDCSDTLLGNSATSIIPQLGPTPWFGLRPRLLLCQVQSGVNPLIVYRQFTLASDTLLIRPLRPSLGPYFPGGAIPALIIDSRATRSYTRSWPFKAA